MVEWRNDLISRRNVGDLEAQGGWAIEIRPRFDGGSMVRH